MKRNLLVVSTSTVHGSPYLSYIMSEVQDFFRDVDEIIFVPYARPSGVSWESYSAKAAAAFAEAGMNLRGLETFADPVAAIREAKGVFTGGGNTFVLLKELYDSGVLDVLRHKILDGMPYMGTSAGSNITGMTIGTTNDMPIVYPPSFEALGVLPVNINPHYLDPDPDSKHMGETRETRIFEFHTMNNQPVIGLREGSWLEIRNEKALLKGALSARLFSQGKDPEELSPNTDISFLL